MKKIMFMIAFFSAFSFSQAFAGEMSVCTMEYAPVCAEVQVQCIKAPCPAVQETFSNTCMMKANTLAKFLHQGECSSSSGSGAQIGMANPASVYCEKNGGTLNLTTGMCNFSNGQSCEEWAFYRGECSKEGKACTKEYAPVCAQPPMPACPAGKMCAQVIPAPQTYANTCMAQQAGATILKNTSCESEKTLPFCGKDGKTYTNEQTFAPVEVKYQGKCLSQKNEKKLALQLDVFLKQASSQKVLLLEQKVEQASQKQEPTSKIYSVYQFIGYYLKKSMQ